jgi:hypothetical protein
LSIIGGCGTPFVRGGDDSTSKPVMMLLKLFQPALITCTIWMIKNRQYPRVREKWMILAHSYPPNRAQSHPNCTGL